MKPSVSSSGNFRLFDEYIYEQNDFPIFKQSSLNSSASEFTKDFSKLQDKMTSNKRKRNLNAGIAKREITVP